MFRFTQEPSSGSYNHSLVKIKSLVQLFVSVQTLSVLWRLIVAVMKGSAQVKETCIVLYCNVYSTCDV